MKRSSLNTQNLSQRARPPQRRQSGDDAFQEHVLSTLETQGRILEGVETKLESPSLNGGFAELVKKVDKIETSTEQLRQDSAATGKKVDAIHVAIYDPDTGLYGRVKEHTRVLSRTGKGLTWFIGIMIAAVVTGIGKMLYDFFSGHLHFTP